MKQQSPEPFPWNEVMKFGFGVLHLSPRDFWSMTVRELEAAMQAHFGTGGSTISRQWLDKTIADNPDALDNKEKL